MLECVSLHMLVSKYHVEGYVEYVAKAFDMCAGELIVSLSIQCLDSIHLTL